MAEKKKITLSEIRACANKARMDAKQKKVLTEWVLDHLKGNGAFYRIYDIGEQFYFFRPERKLYQIGSLEFRALCNELYGFNGTESRWKYIEEEIIVHCLRHGRHTEVFQFCRYEYGVLYIQQDESHMFRLDGQEIKIVDNGTDGVLFKSNQHEPMAPYSYFPRREKGSVVRDRLVNLPNVIPGQEGRFDLLHCYIYSLFFESLLPTKPVLLITGPKGSGKTTTGRAIKCALLGGKENVDTGLTNDMKDFWAAVCNSYLLCPDNQDTLVKGLADAIAVVATGGKVKKRKYFTTNEMVDYAARCFLMLTSRNPESFKRDDVVDRLLLIEVDRRADFIEEHVLLDELADARGAIWWELLENLNKIVVELQTKNDRESVEFRLADWAKLTLTIAPVLGISNLEQSLRAMEHDKNNFTLEDNPVAKALEVWTEAHPNADWIASGKLFSQILKLYEEKGMEFPFQSAVKFGKELSNLLPELEAEYDIKTERKGGNKRAYLIRSQALSPENGANYMKSIE